MTLPYLVSKKFLGIYTDMLNFSQIDIHCQIYYNRNKCMQESRV